MMENIQAPWIGKEPAAINYPRCPVCGSDEAEIFFFSKSGNCFGCDKCVVLRDYYELEGINEL